MRAIGRRSIISPAVETQASGAQAGAFIAPKISPATCVAADQHATNGRWAACVAKMRGMNITLVTVYLVHTIGLAPENLAILSEITVFTRGLGNPVVMLGDFNMTPDELRSGPYLAAERLECIVPAGPAISCFVSGGSCIDYAVATIGLCHLLSRFEDVVGPF